MQLTLKEALEAGGRPRKSDFRPGWKPSLALRVFAHVQHWYVTKVRGRPEVDLNVMHAAPIVRSGPPSCSGCGAPVGSCAHSGGLGELKVSAEYLPSYL